MTTRPRTVLVVGATGSIGRLVVEEAIRQGHPARALVRHPDKARRLPTAADVVVGDVTRPETLTAAVDGIDAVVFTLGSDGAGKVGAETVDYGGVRNVLAAVGKRTVRVALMTSIGVTNRTGAYNLSTEAHDWKRRSERLVRASGLPYTSSSQPRAPRPRTSTPCSPRSKRIPPADLTACATSRTCRWIASRNACVRNCTPSLAND